MTGLFNPGTGKAFSTSAPRYHDSYCGAFEQVKIKRTKSTFAGGPIFTAILLILLFILQRHLLICFNDAIALMRNYNLLTLFSLIQMKYPAKFRN